MVTDAQIDSDIVDDFIAANVLGRSIKPASERPSNEVMVVVSQLLPEAQLCPAVVPWPSYPPQQPPDIFHASAPPLPSFSTFANLNNSYSVLQNAGAGIPFSSEWPNQCEMGYENPFLPFPGANMPAFALSSSSPQPPRNTGFNPHEQHCSGVTVVKEMEQDQAEEWCKPFNPPKKRKFIKKKSPKSKDHPVTDSQIYLDIDDFIAANVLGRCIKPASERPSNDIVVVSQQAAKGLLPDAQSCPAVVPWPGYPHQQPPEIFHTSAPPLPSYSTFANLNNSYSMQQNPGPGIPFSSEWPSPYELGYENPFLPFPGANMPACVPYPPATESSLPYRPQACILSSSSPQPLESRGFSPYEQHCSGHNIPDLLTLDSFEDFSEETMRNQELFQRSSLQENPFP
ncbi:uncharacterized protein LOC136746903 [Amia ocellicauda]|uniref:uncharacterized protein LOC136746903 n=1 Tax=Amia ocellicauda TaxID=2972642 RepID=UPI003464D970